MIRLIGVYLQLCLVVHLANAQHQLAFGIHTGQQVRRQQQEEPRAHHHDEAPLSSSSSSSSSSLSPSDLHHYALTLLSQITQHSTLSSHTPQTPYLPQSYLTSNTRGGGPDSTTRSRVFQKCLELLERVYGGKKESREDRKRSGKLDYSIRGVVLGLKGLVERFNHNDHQNKSSGSTGSSSLGSRDSRNWRERLEKLNLATGIGGGGLNEEETRQGMNEVVKLMRDAGERGNGDSLNWLGDLNLFGHLTVPVNTSASTEFYTLANEKNGNVESQYKLGFLYGTNYDHAFQGSGGKGQQGSALLHYTFSALSGHVPSSMTVGYRHWAGIGTKQSCKDALPWYKSAAESAIRSFNSGPPGGLHLPPIKLRLSDLNGGVYGPSSGSSKPLILSTGGSTAQSLSEWKDLIEFHQFHAEKGDQVYMFRLARLFYGGFSAGGLGGIRSFESSSSRLSLGGLGQVKDGMWDGGRDFGKSFRWFSKVCKKVWSGDGKEALWDVNKFGPYNSGSGGGGGAARDARSSSTPMTKKSSSTTNSVLGYYDSKLDKKNDKLDDQTLMVSGLAAGYLGRMYLRGEGVQVNFQKAFLWFKRGTTRGDRESHNGLGVMYRDGLGVERNLKTSLLQFHSAAQQDLAEAQVNLGKYHFGLGDRVLATTFFEAAIRTDGIRQPDTFQAYYYLAELASTNDQSGSGGDNCPVTVSFYKHVAERGDWDHEVWWEAERARDRGDLRKALLGYWIMAERGYEVAQNNVAWILDRDKSRIRVPLLDKAPTGSNETDRIALTYWTRSAAQDNVDALVKLGDYYFKGIGTTSTSASTSASSSLGSFEEESEEEEEKDDSNRRRRDNELGGPQFEKAATFYQSAATSRLSAMAMWNLGWMHETGQGVPQDFHLAKRYLDSALETSPSAYFPSTLSLISLYTRALYHVIFSPSSSSEEMNALSLFGKDPSSASSDDLQREKQEKGFVPQGGWGFGRAWRDIQRSWGIDPGPEPEVIPLRSPTGANTGGNNNPGENQAQNNHETRNGGQEPWESAQHEAILNNNNNNNKRQPRRVGEDEEDDEFFIGGDEDDGDLGGTVAIIALCMLLAWLVYFRQRPRDNQNQNRQAPVAAPVPGQTPAPPQQAQATPPTRAREEEEEPRRLV